MKTHVLCIAKYMLKLQILGGDICSYYLRYYIQQLFGDDSQRTSCIVTTKCRLYLKSLSPTGNLLENLSFCVCVKMTMGSGLFIVFAIQWRAFA